MALDETVAEEYWHAATAGNRPMPGLEGDPVPAFLAMLSETLPTDIDSAFRLEPAAIEDPYPGIAVADSPTAEMHAWAIDIAGLVPFSSKALKDYTLYVDTVADRQGNHRVYPFVDGSPAEDFGSLNDALRWMTATVLFSQKLIERSAVEAVDAALETPEDWNWSGAEIVLALRGLPLPNAWKAWSRHKWPPFAGNSASMIGADEPGIARLAMLLACETLLRSRKATDRDGLEAGLSGAQLAMLDHLDDLAESVTTGEEPTLIGDTANSDSKRLAERAQRWRARFEKSTPTGEPEAPRPRTTEEISDALDVAITELARRELIEISARRITHLADELLRVALRAGPVDDLIDRLCKALVDSDRVDEIYADDDEIRKILSDALSAN